MITNSDLSGASALYAKSGYITINGGTYIGSGKRTFQHAVSGMYATGDAIVLESCDYPGGAPILEINDGTFISKQKDAVADYTVESTQDESVIEISKGEFSSSVAEYVTDDLKYEAASDVNGKTVYTYHRTTEDAVEAAGETGTVATIAAAIAGADEPTYSVTFNNDGAETTFTVAKNEIISLLPPTKPGYTFKGWQVDDALVTETAYQITADTVFTAQWEKDSVPVTGVTVAPATLSLVEGGTATLTAAVVPENATDTSVTWTTSDSNVATVDQNGVVTAVAPGTATITVTTTDGGFSDTCAVTVEARTVTVTFENVDVDPITVLPGTEIELPTPDDTRDEIFRYWTVAGDPIGTRYYGGETVEITEDITFVANWKDNSYIPIPPTQPTKPTKPAEPDEPDEPEEPVESELPFTDVDVDDTFYEAVKYVSENGLMTGVDTTAFAPYNEFTRAQVATILYRLEKEPAVAFAATFPDVQENQWFASAVLWGNSKGILLGHDTGKFGPDDGVTFEQMLTILYRYAALKGYDTAARADVAGFECSDYAAEAVSWAMAHGMVTAADGAALKAPAARCQVAQVLAVFCQTVVMK